MSDKERIEELAKDLFAEWSESQDNDAWNALDKFTQQRWMALADFVYQNIWTAETSYDLGDR